MSDRLRGTSCMCSSCMCLLMKEAVGCVFSYTACCIVGAFQEGLIVGNISPEEARDIVDGALAKVGRVLS